MKINPTIALIAGAFAVALPIAGVASYRASVREQACLSYERQGIVMLDKTTKVAQKVQDAALQVKANPFAALGLLPMVTGWGQEMDEINGDLNDWKHAYVGTCGAERHAKYTETEAVRDRVARLTNLSRSLQSF